MVGLSIQQLGHVNAYGSSHQASHLFGHGFGLSSLVPTSLGLSGCIALRWKNKTQWGRDHPEQSPTINITMNQQYPFFSTLAIIRIEHYQHPSTIFAYGDSSINIGNHDHPSNPKTPIFVSRAKSRFAGLICSGSCLKLQSRGRPLEFSGRDLNCQTWINKNTNHLLICGG